VDFDANFFIVIDEIVEAEPAIGKAVWEIVDHHHDQVSALE
jgi:hypothetical protein